MSRRTLTAFLIILLAASSLAFFPFSTNKPKNVILFIGDGMGVTHVTAAKIANPDLNLQRFKTLGLVTTFPQNALVTDSAAAGTALATGHKTYNGAISVSLDKTPLKTALEVAEENGKKTGLVASCSVTHATPASFAAHAESRGLQNLIAEHIANSGVDVLFGGGWAFFVPQSVEGSRRTDDKNPLAQLQKRMQVIQLPEDFYILPKNVDSVAGLFAPNHTPDVTERKPQLHELTQKSIEILSKNKKGFFLMVEGSQIDWAAHANQQDLITTETLDFDKAVGVGLDFAERNGKTLVIVTADHETGGFAIHNGSVEDRVLTASGFTTKGHTAAMVPLFAYGPGSSEFAGIQDNTNVGQKIIHLLR